jgi:tetratricopeptide (TPR) repeat protein
VTLVNGPPGAGKTTLVASYLTSRNLRALWYQVDSGDDDVATFFHYFSQAARQHLPPEDASLRDFDPAVASDLTSFSRRFFREFYARAATPLVVVLDNYQELPEGSPSHDLVRIACEETPDHCHVVIVSREACPKSLGRIRFNQSLTLIGSDELALTLEETRGLAESRGLKLQSKAAINALQEHSAGWMMGLMLLLERTETCGAPDTDPCLNARHCPGEPAFDYFAGEVFENFDVESRDLLLQCALFRMMTVHRVTQLTGTPKAGELLLDFRRRNCFVIRDGGNESAYQFHPLFREFLLNQGTRRFAAAELTSQRCKAAEISIADGDDEGALALLEQAGAWPRMKEVILATAPALRMQGRLATLAIWISKLPADLVDAEPWLLYWQASSRTFSEPEDSQAILQKAYRQFSAANDFPGMALSWSGVIEVIFSLHRDLRRMDPWIVEFDDRLADRLDELPADCRARVTLAVFVALSFRQPLHHYLWIWRERLCRMLETETRASEHPRLRQHLVMHHILRGEHAEAECILSMLHYADRLPAAERPFRTPVDHINEAMVAMHVGMADRGLRAVTEGLRAAEGTGNRLFDSVLLQLGAVMCLNRGKFSGADEFLASFERLAEALPSVDRGAYYAVSAWRKFQSGESQLAIQLLSRAASASEARGTAYYIAVDHLGLGLLLQLCGKVIEARRHLELGREVGNGIGNILIEYAYQLFSAFVALDLGDDKKAHEHLASGMRLGREQGYMHFFFFPPPVISRLCLVALEAEIETDYVRALIERNEFTPNPAWRQADAWPWPLRIYTLGRFGVLRNGEALRFTGKAQKKPLELLKALIAFGGRDVSEARLADALWPGAEGDASAQALATTLFRLRKLIGEQAIRRQDHRLTLDATICWVDCWAFERLSSEEAADSPQRLAKLRELHKGPFLDGADDAPWAQPMRARLHTKLARALRAFLSTALLGVAAAEDACVFRMVLVELMAL